MELLKLFKSGVPAMESKVPEYIMPSLERRVEFMDRALNGHPYPLRVHVWNSNLFNRYRQARILKVLDVLLCLKMIYVNTGDYSIIHEVKRCYTISQYIKVYDHYTEKHGVNTATYRFR